MLQMLCKMEETPSHIWDEVKYGDLEHLKILLRDSTAEQASRPGGPNLTSPLHEAITRSDVGMVNALRKARVSLIYTPPYGPSVGLTPRKYAEQRQHAHQSMEQRKDAETIARNLYQEEIHADVYALQHAEIARMAETRRLALEEKQRPDRCVAFGMGHHNRLGENSYYLPYDLVNEIMKHIGRGAAPVL